MLEEIFQKYGGAQIVGPNVTLNLVHGLPDPHLGGLMKDGMHALQGFSDRLSVTDICMNELSARIKVLRFPASVYLGYKQIQNPHAMPKFDQGIREMRTNEAGASRN